MSTKILLATAAGALAGIAFVLSCGDDGPAAVDAAPVCDCPAAEPPLDGRIVHEEHATNPIPAGVVTPVSYPCSAPGAILLAGGCHLDDQALAQSGDIHLVESYTGAGGGGWTCRWDNKGAVEAATTIILTCLNPAP